VSYWALPRNRGDFETGEHMKSSIPKIAGACVATATLMIAAPVLAQSGGTTGTDNSRTTTTQERNDHRDWGWIGLLGLAGLLGLRKRDDRPDHTRNVSGRTA
jgi:MYXO-CTERM domain-containing protein